MNKLVMVTILFLCLASADSYWELVGFENSNVKCIAQHPQDTNIILISIADSILRSSDGGSSWSTVANFSFLPINGLMFNPTSGDTAYAVIGNGSYSDGIYYSIDAGDMWDVLSWFYIPLCMTVTESGIILVGCDSFGIYKSEDGGMFWVPWNEGLTNTHVYSLDYCCPFDTFPYFFAGTAQGLFYRHHNGWSQADGLPTDLRVASISYSKVNELGFAAVTGGSFSDGIYRSTNFGQNWQVVDWWLYASSVLMNPQWEYYPGDTFSIFSGDSGLGVKHSTDCGTTWDEENAGLGNFYINALSYHPADTLRLFCGTQSGLYRYTYPTVVNENSINTAGSIIEIPQTILHVHEPIFIRYNNTRGEPFKKVELYIFDLTGRKIRTDKISSNNVLLEPLKKCGIYFIVSPEGKYYFKEKLIIID
jgi:hypothetical protein